MRNLLVYLRCVYFVTNAVQGWRWSYILTGLPGFAFALILILTVREPVRKEIDVTNDISRSNLHNDDKSKSLVEEEQVDTKSNCSDEGNLNFFWIKIS